MTNAPTYVPFTIEKSDTGDTVAHLRFYAGIAVSLEKIKEFKAITDPAEKLAAANEFTNEVMEAMREQVLDVVMVRADEILATANMDFDQARIH